MTGRGVPRSSRWRRAGPLVVLALVAALLSGLINGFVARLYAIPSGSMETTLHGCAGCADDRVLVDRTAYRFGEPRPGDIVVFVGPPSWQDAEAGLGADTEASGAITRAARAVGTALGLGAAGQVDFVKRVIAVGGQTVSCCDDHNRVVVDGRAIDEPYRYFLPEAGPPVETPFGPVRVPAHQLWVMGDSRNNSADSRVPGLGPVPVDDVIGRARWIVLPPGRFGPIGPAAPGR